MYCIGTARLLIDDVLTSLQMFWAVRRYTSLELSFNAVERIVEFMEMDQEAPAIVEPRPPASVSH